MPKKIADKVRIEVFRTGTMTPMTGNAINFTAADLEAVAANYDPDVSRAPVVVGHPKTDDPAFAWIDGFEYDTDKDRLFADISDIDPAFGEAVQSGSYKNVSMSFYMPTAANNPVPGNLYPKHLGFLGAAAPAVSGLKPAEFATTDETQIVTFVGEMKTFGFSDVATIFRSLRDGWIEKFGLEEADKVLPSWRIEWVDDAEIKPEVTTPTSFSQPTSTLEPTMNPEELAALAAREKKVADGEKTLAANASKARHDGHVSFAETLITDGKLLPAQKNQVVGFLNAFPDDQEISFAEGEEKKPVATAFMDFLKAQPKVIEFGQVKIGDEPTGDANPLDVANAATAHRTEMAAKGVTVGVSESVAFVEKQQGTTS